MTHKDKFKKRVGHPGEKFVLIFDTISLKLDHLINSIHLDRIRFLSAKLSVDFDVQFDKSHVSH